MLEQTTTLPETWSLKREMLDLIYHTEHLAAVWQNKLIGSVALAGIAWTFNVDTLVIKQAAESLFVLFGADCFLLFLVFLLVCLDFALGIMQACYKKRFSWPIFKRGISKYPLYTVYIFLMATMSISLHRSTGYGSGLLNLFLAYLCMTEIFSIIKNFERLGVYVPPILLHIIYGVSHKIEKTIKDTYKHHDEESASSIPESFYTMHDNEKELIDKEIKEDSNE